MNEKFSRSVVWVFGCSIELRAPRHDRDAQGRDCSCRLRDRVSLGEHRQEVVRAHYDNYHPLALEQKREASDVLLAQSQVCQKESLLC